MIKHFFVFSGVVLLLLAGCHSIDENHTDVIDNSHEISIDDALSALNEFISVYNSQTKSNDDVKYVYSPENIQSISASSLYPIFTKSVVSAPDRIDNLLYLVNFDDGSGFAVLAADDRLCDNILCIAESGSIFETDFTDAIKTLMSDSREPKRIITKEGCKVFLSTLLLSSVLSSFERERTCIPHTKSYVPTTTKYGPYVLTKWTQEAVGWTNVFNAYTPNNAPAGCVVIAVAQILLSTSSFTFVTTDNYICSSAAMRTVAPYTNPFSTGTGDAAVQAGKFVYELGSQSSLVNVSYPNIFHLGTSATADDAKRALEAFMYTNVVKRTGFDDTNKSLATAQIREGRPVYLAGQPNGTIFEGHAWLLDGEWDPYYHVNWGWNGLYDGYYSKGVFDTTQCQFYDSQIDSISHFYIVRPSELYLVV